MVLRKLTQSLDDCRLPRTVLLLGTNRGYVHMVHLNGRLLLRERLHDGPCSSITVGGGGGDDSAAAITLGFTTAIARVETVQVFPLPNHCLRSCHI